MTPEELDSWYPQEQLRPIVAHLKQRVGLTRRRIECFGRLWVYLLVKQQRAYIPRLKPPLAKLELLEEAISCTHREAAELFYGGRDSERGSDRAAGMMLDRLAALGLIKKSFDGNTTLIEIQPIAEILAQVAPQATPVKLLPDAFDPRCDAIPVANLLATNYNWMNRNNEAVPHRIARLLRGWAKQYAIGMRVLRHSESLHPVGFYLLYPTTSESEVNFFKAPSKGLHLSSMADVDPFKLALPGDEACLSVFIRSWMIEPTYIDSYRILFLEDVQQVLRRMRQDFPQLCDLYTLIIHPNYEKMAQALGFQRTGHDGPLSVYWMYLPLDRWLALDIKAALAKL